MAIYNMEWRNGQKPACMDACSKEYNTSWLHLSEFTLSTSSVIVALDHAPPSPLDSAFNFCMSVKRSPGDLRAKLHAVFIICRHDIPSQTFQTRHYNSWFKVSALNLGIDSGKCGTFFTVPAAGGAKHRSVLDFLTDFRVSGRTTEQSIANRSLGQEDFFVRLAGERVQQPGSKEAVRGDFEKSNSSYFPKLATKMQPL